MVNPRRKAELGTPIIAYPEMLWKKQYRVRVASYLVTEDNTLE